MENLEQTDKMPLDDISLYEEDLCEITCNDMEATNYNNEGVELEQVLVSIVGMSFETNKDVKKIYKDYAI